MLNGNGDVDSYWADANGSEIINAEPSEAGRNIHRVNTFANGASKELLGQDFADPAIDDDDDQGFAYPISRTLRDGNPLFASAGPVADDVMQGGVGDCWFVAVLSALCSDWSLGGFDTGDNWVPSHCYEVVSCETPGAATRAGKPARGCKTPTTAT